MSSERLSVVEVLFLTLVRGLMVAAFVTVISPPYLLMVARVDDGFKPWMLLGLLWPGVLAFATLRSKTPLRKTTVAVVLGYMAAAVAMATEW